MTNRISHDHHEAFLEREERQTQALRNEQGGKLVSKLDTWLLRDALYARRQQQFEDLLEVPDAERHRPKVRVMVNLRSGRQSDNSVSSKFRARTSSKAKPAPAAVTRSELRRRLQTAGQMAIGRLQEGLKEDGIEIEQTIWLSHSVVVELEASQMAKLARREDVRGLNHDKRVFALALDSSRPIVRADQVENTLGFTGSGVNVAVIDTGVDFSHRALAGSMGSQVDLTGEGTGDLFGHGSHCAGIVGSRDRKFRGMAPTATISDIKIMDQNASTSPSTAVLGLQTAVTLNVDVASNSWGFSHGNGAWVCAAGDCVLCQAADALVTNGGIVVVVAGGNEDNDGCSTFDTHLRCPGNAREVITVAASDDGDSMADFSSLGPTNDGRAKPDVTAPGVDIVSVRASTGSDMGGSAPVVEEVFAQASGTSMACPHVAGIAALMLEKTSKATPADIKNALMTTAVDIGATANEMGVGRVDALDAVNAI